MSVNTNPTYNFNILGNTFTYQKGSDSLGFNIDTYFEDSVSCLDVFSVPLFRNINVRVERNKNPLLFLSLLNLLVQIAEDSIRTGVFAEGDLIITKNEFVIDAVYCGKIAVESIEQIIRVKTTTERDGTEYFYALVSDIPKNADCARWLTITKDSYNNIVSLFNGG